MITESNDAVCRTLEAPSEKSQGQEQAMEVTKAAEEATINAREAIRSGDWEHFPELSEKAVRSEMLTQDQVEQITWELLEHGGPLDHTLQWVDSASRRFPRLDVLFFLRGCCHYLQGSLGQAAKDIQNAVKLWGKSNNKKVPVWICTAAIILLANARHADALRLLRKSEYSATQDFWLDCLKRVIELRPEVARTAAWLQVEALKAGRSRKGGHETLEEKILDDLNGGDQLLDMLYVDEEDRAYCDWTTFLRGKCRDWYQKDGAIAQQEAALEVDSHHEQSHGG